MPRVIGAAREKSRLTKEEWREYTKTVWHIANTTHAEHPAVFPVEIPHRLIKLFSWHGETVLDPFAGTGTTAAAAVPLGRRVLCIEQNRKYVDIIRRDCSHLTNGHLTAIELMNVVHGDSRDISFIEDDSVSLIVSSPPYWNKADYGSARANLGRVAGYRRFLDKIKPVFEECFRVLQPGRNLKIEIASHHGAPYPDAGPPIAVYRELQARSFAYMLLMPGEPGYDAMTALTEGMESVGRGLPRVLADAAAIRGSWPECPLVTAVDALAKAHD